MRVKKDLRSVKKLLTNYFCYFKHADVLVISESKEVLPFAYLVHDPDHPKVFLLSLAVDYPYTEKAVEVSLLANHIRPVIISDAFFIAQTGTTHVGDEAQYYHEMEVDLPIADVFPLSDTKH